MCACPLPSSYQPCHCKPHSSEDCAYTYATMPNYEYIAFSLSHYHRQSSQHNTPTHAPLMTTDASRYHILLLASMLPSKTRFQSFIVLTTPPIPFFLFFFFKNPAPPEFSPFPLPDALPI